MKRKFSFVCALAGAVGMLGSNLAYSAPAIEKTSIAAIIQAKRQAAAEAAQAAEAKTETRAEKRHTTARKAASAHRKAVKASARKATSRKNVAQASARKKPQKVSLRKISSERVSKEGVTKKVISAKVTAPAAGKTPYAGIISRYAATYGVPTSLAHAVVRHESGYRADARGAAGEIGLMQVKLSTARGLGYTGSAAGLYDPATNVQYGMKYLAMARKLGGGSTCGTILKYNAGHGATRMNPISAAYCSQVKVYMRSF
ncbi:lytic transglycosylase domain-containing protein [Phyllobacterium salinisoli]|uniref:Lytic transglycosylase domain-containing protein n=1 Tax=Phyllobacterium salinisoli TaxID=1899321 RepID=A0A368KBM6_9HYPH|nr:transglycosylase SLT domain-containing protein [Phyllobacterium salinisoli]RCS25480.1 lytic transglycosylase domain-containing protein [Phyllobacterium salinisoli]